MANPMEIPRPLTPVERNSQPPVSMYRRQPGVSRTIVEFLENHPDREFTPETIAAQTGLALSSVKSAMSKLVQKDAIRQNEKVRGLYVAVSNGDSGPRDTVTDGDQLTVARMRPDGDIVLIDPFGGFWVATLVDI